LDRGVGEARLVEEPAEGSQTAGEHPEAHIVRVQEVTRVYRSGASSVQALRGVTLDIPAGVFAALKGRSGSGKTTLLNIIGGLDRPSSGTVQVYGQHLSALSGSQLTDLRRHRIGFVFQSFALVPIFSAFENVELMLRIAGVRRGRAERSMQSLDLVGLGRWANHRPWELSGGQQQRVAIARAMVTRPGLVLADEPTGELDSVTGRHIMALFRHIVDQQGVTILMATHDPVVEDYADLICELSDGRIQTVRSLGRLHAQPLQPHAN
jgi:ABC-type lipoprotein export system ATPase subunit